MNRFGSSSRTADDGKTPSVIGTVTVFPVRSSVIVMVSGTCFPSCHVCGGFSPFTAQASSIQGPVARERTPPACPPARWVGVGSSEPVIVDGGRGVRRRRHAEVPRNSRLK